MSAIHWLLHILRDPGDLIAYGISIIALIIFIESAVFPLLPGDSLLVVAGIYASKGDINLPLLIVLLIPAAIVGNAFAYLLGNKAGPKLFANPNSRLWKPSYAEKAHEFYAKHGGAAIVIARFVPIVRTFVPVVAGIAGMPYKKFFGFNVAGAVAWILSMTLIGYFVGDLAAARGFPLDKHIEKVIIVVVLLSLLPALVEYLRSRKKA